MRGCRAAGARTAASPGSFRLPEKILGKDRTRARRQEEALDLGVPVPWIRRMHDDSLQVIAALKEESDHFEAYIVSGEHDHTSISDGLRSSYEASLWFMHWGWAGQSIPMAASFHRIPLASSRRYGSEMRYDTSV